MPNWVFNNLDVTGTNEDIEAFKSKASKPYTTYHKGKFLVNEDGTKTYDPELVEEELRESPLSFMNFISPENLELYYSTGSIKPDGYEEMTIEEKMAYALKFDSDGWYDWNIRTWGTKWDARESEIVYDHELNNVRQLSYKFDTPWGIADGSFESMIKQHPELSFEFYWEEEQGWGGEAISRDGKFVITKEWDIPDSHADYVERDRVDSCVCTWASDDGDWYDDCPKED